MSRSMHAAMHKLVVLGDEGVGKTALSILLCRSQFVETYDPTTADPYQRQAVIDGRSCKLEVLDTGGKEYCEPYRDQWIRDNECFLLVYSITSRKSFIGVKQFHDQIRRTKDSADDTSTGGAQTYPVMLVGNKSDEEDKREVSEQEGAALAKELGCGFVETSAKTAKNVERAFYDVVRLLRRTDGDHSQSEISVRERSCGRQCVIL